MVETIIARAQGDRPQPAQDLIAPSSIGGSHGASYEREGSTLDGSDGTPPPPQGPSSSGPVRKRNDRTDDPSRRHHCTHPGCGKAFTTYVAVFVLPVAVKGDCRTAPATCRAIIAFIPARSATPVSTRTARLALVGRTTCFNSAHIQ
jgi:hypothetical protein